VLNHKDQSADHSNKKKMHEKFCPCRDPHYTEIHNLPCHAVAAAGTHPIPLVIDLHRGTVVDTIQQCKPSLRLPGRKAVEQ
jgi:hypothetical protein